MRYRYKPVFDGDELIAFAYWTGNRVQHYYVKKSFFFRSLIDSRAPTVPDKHVIKSLEGMTLKDYPEEVQTQVKQLRLGKEALTDELPPGFKIENMREFVNWDQSKARDYGKTIREFTIWKDWKANVDCVPRT